jgi:glycosyltransferase involved in cell wall biosynthesis
MISIILRTYNRARTLPRAINSVLNQDYPDWELVIVDDGSTDDTAKALAQYNDPRIHVISHCKNLGPTAAFNTGLANMHGEWFTGLDSDDELMPNALSTMIQIPQKIDPAINAITSNCIDSVSGQFTGTGVDHDQYLDAETSLQKRRGEYWGLTRTSLLQGENIPEELGIGFEGVLWHKIDKRAKRYYVHQGLRIYHTEGENRVTKENLIKNARVYRGYLALMKEKEYLEDYRKWALDLYREMYFSAALCFLQNNDKKNAWNCFRELLSTQENLFRLSIILAGILLGNRAIVVMKNLKKRFFLPV